MCMRFVGLIAVIPATMFLAVSFFVLFAAGKTELAGLKKFAKTIAVLLWICSALIFTAGVSTVFMGGCPMMKHHMKCCGMSQGMDCQQGMMQQGMVCDKMPVSKKVK